VRKGQVRNIRKPRLFLDFIIQSMSGIYREQW